MLRLDVRERPHWKALAEELGFHFHTLEGEPYWVESAYYQFTLRQVEEEIEAPTEAIHEMCMELVDRVCDSEALLARLAIPEFMWETLVASWRGGQPSLYGRLDFSYDGRGPAKLLELNYDTPTSLYEAAFFQWVWLEQAMQLGLIPRQADQYNAIQERLLMAFAHLRERLPGGTLHFASVQGSVEDRATVRYLQDIALQAGFEVPFLHVEEIGLNRGDAFVGLDDEPIEAIFKLYPWEEMVHEDFGAHLPDKRTHWFEPPWKMILSNKGILPLLWEHFEGHPNLLPAFFEEVPGRALGAGWVRKPFFSREGSNIELVTAAGERHWVDGPYTDSPRILQALAPLPRFGDRHTLVGSWVVGDRACGMGLREDVGAITKDSSCFLPHLIL
ncbi:glutathionylspermidine synthase family protein [Halomonas salifodinae]|uniref:glutathionylspermidine synthase family protein n=1 Tax=Halomonas salifodinae TaxID=438745 RepID=UPI0033A7044F